MQSTSKGTLRHWMLMLLPGSALVLLFLLGYTAQGIGSQTANIAPGSLRTKATPAPAALTDIRASAANTVVTGDIWIIIKDMVPNTPTPVEFPAAIPPDLCEDPRALKISGWAISGQTFDISNPMVGGNSSMQLEVAWCEDPYLSQRAPGSDTLASNPLQLVTSSGTVQPLPEDAQMNGHYRYDLTIDSPLGIYQLLVPIGHSSYITVPLHVTSSGRIYGIDRDSRELQDRFPTLADVTVAGDGFEGQSEVTARLLQINPDGNNYMVTALDPPWSLPVDDNGSFTATIEPSIVQALEGAGAVMMAGETALDSPQSSSAFAGIVSSEDSAEQQGERVAVIVCRSDGCDWKPIFDIKPPAPLTAKWPEIYAATLNIDSLAGCKSALPALELRADNFFESEKLARSYDSATALGTDFVASMAGGLAVEAEVVSNAADGSAANCGSQDIASFDFRILASTGEEVYSVSDNAAPFCALKNNKFLAGGFRPGCGGWNFDKSAAGRYTWPNGKPAVEGIYTVQADWKSLEGQVQQLPPLRIMLVLDFQ